LPNLSNAPYVAPANVPVQPVLLLVSERQEIAPDLVNYWGRRSLEICLVRSERDLDDVLARGLPTGIAWDMGAASETEWRIIQRLRGTPVLCGLPFLLYGHGSAETHAGVLLKPVKPKTLLNVLGAVFRDNDPGAILIVDDDPEARRIYEEIVTGQISG